MANLNPKILEELGLTENDFKIPPTTQEEKNKANIDYLSMMVDVPLPNEEDEDA